MSRTAQGTGVATRIIRAIVADDEPLARRALLRLLGQAPDVEVIGEAEDVPSLTALVHHVAGTPPDVIFLDVRMPGGSGFDILRSLAPQTSVVFTTAFAEHAASAFDVDAVDFLRKPFGATRLHQALERVRRRISLRSHTAGHSAADSDTLLVRVGMREIPVQLASVWRFESADDCVRVILPERTLVHTATLQALASWSAARDFLRIHRRHLVNARAIRAVLPHDERRVALEFPDGSRVVCSRPGTALVRRWTRARRGGPAPIDESTDQLPTA